MNIVVREMESDGTTFVADHLLEVGASGQDIETTIARLNSSAIKIGETSFGEVQDQFYDLTGGQNCYVMVVHQPAPE